MSSEFSCDYCSACPRHPCYSEAEASTCPNCDNRGAYLNFDAQQVAEWIRTNSRWKSDVSIIRLEAAAKAIEDLL